MMSILKDLILFFFKAALIICLVVGTLRFIDHHVTPSFLSTTPIESMVKRLQPMYKFKDFKLFSQDVQFKYYPLTVDAETISFLKGCNVIETRPFAYIGQKIVYQYLKPFVTLTSLHAFLNRGGMFVLSVQQARNLLEIPEDEPEKSTALEKFKNVADLGAGDGNVSKRIAETLNLPRSKIKTTDVSPSMKYRLKEKGFTVVNETTWHENEVFDAIFMLNLLDRCEKPQTMLSQAFNSLSSDKDDHSRLIVSLVFPIKQSIEWRKSRRADEKITISSEIPLEEQIKIFLQLVMRPAGFKLLKFTKVPYLSEGDIKNPFYSLTNIVMVFKKKNK